MASGGIAQQAGKAMKSIGKTKRGRDEQRSSRPGGDRKCMQKPVSFLGPATSPGIRRMAASGLAAILIGIGRSRFAYTPLLPALIRSGWFATAAAAVGIFVVSPAPAALAISAIVVGAFVPGIVLPVLGRIHALTASDAARRNSAWSVCVAAFALGQAAGAYSLAFVFAETGGDYAPLFAIGSAVRMLAFAIDVAAWAVLFDRDDPNATAH